MLVAVDLYRLKLIELLGYKHPKDPNEEKQIWTALGFFVAQGDSLQDKVQFK